MLTQLLTQLMQKQLWEYLLKQKKGDPNETCI